MPYRRTRKYSAERLRAIREGKARARLERPAQERAPELPELRMRITVERFDFGVERHVFELRRTRRCDVSAEMTLDDFAGDAYAFADAMLRAREA